MTSNIRSSSQLSLILPCNRRPTEAARQLVRWQSTFISTPSHIPRSKTIEPPIGSAQGITCASPISRLTTWSLMRNVLLSFFLTRPLLLKPGLAIMRVVAESKSRLLNPDTNPAMRAVIKPLIYDQFCAGTSKAEIESTIKEVQQLGFAGVILCYGKEIQLNKENKILGAQGQRAADIQQWLEGNLQTLDMIDEGNWLGMKFTGAGQDVTEALLRGKEAPKEFMSATKIICDKAKQKNCRLWVDSEQQAVQAGIDQWTIALMREYNRASQPLVYNTVQAYLKQSRTKLRTQLGLAETEGWTLGVKLVRGAYIANDTRELIHNTKADTDASYNGIVHDLMTGTFEGFSPKNFPHMGLFLAGHNTETVRAALQLGKQLASRGELKVCPEFGQLQGMADDIGCEIIAFGEEAQSMRHQESQSSFVPKAYKCLNWGTVQECMQYLIRRAIENSAAVGRMKEGATQARRELYRRMKPRAFRSES